MSLCHCARWAAIPDSYAACRWMRPFRRAIVNWILFPTTHPSSAAPFLSISSILVPPLSATPPPPPDPHSSRHSHSLHGYPPTAVLSPLLYFTAPSLQPFSRLSYSASFSTLFFPPRPSRFSFSPFVFRHFFFFFAFCFSLRALYMHALIRSPSLSLFFPSTS